MNKKIIALISLLCILSSLPAPHKNTFTQRLFMLLVMYLSVQTSASEYEISEQALTSMSSETIGSLCQHINEFTENSAYPALAAMATQVFETCCQKNTPDTCNEALALSLTHLSNDAEMTRSAEKFNLFSDLDRLQRWKKLQKERNLPAHQNLKISKSLSRKTLRRSR